MTRQLAFDFSHQNIKIRVNGIAPGEEPPMLNMRAYAMFKVTNNRPL